jgi:hypothetical protein
MFPLQREPQDGTQFPESDVDFDLDRTSRAGGEMRFVSKHSKF